MESKIKKQQEFIKRQKEFFKNYNICKSDCIYYENSQECENCNCKKDNYYKNFKQKCIACNGSGYYDNTDEHGNAIYCSACDGTGFEEDEEETSNNLLVELLQELQKEIQELRDFLKKDTVKNN